jgi:hypothetical protein
LTAARSATSDPTINKEKPMNTPVTDTNAPRTSPLAGTVIAESFAGWSAEILQHTDDGTTRRVVYRAGETRHFSFPGDEYILHDLYNDGPSELAFLTVEYKSERKQD